MASEVDIINDALGELGEPLITSRTENTPQGKAADRFFDRARKEFLEEANWRFASKYQELAQNASAPEHKFENSFELPSDFIRIIEFNETEVSNVQVPLFERVGTALYTDESSAKIVYVYDAGATEFTPGAARALSFKMADKMCRLLTDSTTQKEEMAERYMKALRSAKATDSMHQRQPIPNKSGYSAFIGAHRGTTGYKEPTVTATSY